MSQSIPGKPVFRALPRLSSRGSTHKTVAGGRALWESLLGKPRGKASIESHRSLDPREGKSATAATAREESARACPHSRRGLTPLERLQKVLHTLLQIKKFPDIPVSTREEAREFPPHPEEPRFRLLAREEGSFPCEVGIEFPAFPSHLKRRRSPQERREDFQGHATIPRVPQISQSIPGKPVFPALPRLSRGGLTHTTVARGTALWESLVGKPRGKASRESLEGKPQIP